MHRAAEIISSWIFFLSLAAPAFGAAAPVRVNIGTASVSSSALSLWIAQEQGIFSRNGIAAQVILVRGGPTLVASIVAGDIQMAFTSGVSVLGAAAQGIEIKILSSISTRVNWKLMANPQIRRSRELAGKTIGVQSIVGSTWMYSMLALEHLGLDPKRDAITFVQTGDPVTTAQALETGRVDAAALDPALSRRLGNKGFTVLIDLAQTPAAFPGLGIGVTRSYLERNPATAEKVVAALVESLAFVQNPSKKTTVLQSMMKNLRMSDPEAAEEAYRDVLGTLSRKPYPSVEGLHNAQRLMAVQNPKIGSLKVEELVDSRFIRSLDERGFIDKLYGGGR
jgi:NitT/TauT family transport system substrate-binding protein